MADNPTAEPPRRLSPDMIAALSAVLIGVCALAVSLYQATLMREQSRLMREQQRASVWPNVAIENSYSGEAFELRVVNTGVGPAKIGAVRVSFDGEPIRTWTEWIRAVHPAPRINYDHSKVGDRVLPANTFERVFAVSDPALAESLRSQVDRLAMEICYCSVYDECWRYVHGFDGQAERSEIEQCSASGGAFHQ